MKKLILVSSLAFISSVFAVGYSEDGTVKIYDKIKFPGHGLVDANKVCYSLSDNSFNTLVPARTIRECLFSRIDRSDSTRPREVCLKWTTTRVGPMHLKTPARKVISTCLRWDRSDSTRPKCLEKKYDEVDASRTVTLKVYQTYDYRRENPDYRCYTIEDCK